MIFRHDFPSQNIFYEKLQTNQRQQGFIKINLKPFRI